MNNGLYAAYLGMRARQRTLDVIANNIANASTAGFKADRLLYSSVAAAQKAAAQTDINGPAPQSATNAANQSDPANNQPDNQNAALGDKQVSSAEQNSLHSLGVTTGSAVDFGAGAIRETGRPLDVAMSENDFLAVQTPRGERFTRAGSLTLDASGQLVTQSGEFVIGEDGPITVPPGNVMIGEDGTISVNDQRAGRLKLAHFTNPRAALAKEADSLFVLTGTEKPAAASNGRIMQGALEASNVNPVSEMVAMMQNTREFDSLQRSISLLMNDIGRKVSNELGRI